MHPPRNRFAFPFAVSLCRLESDDAAMDMDMDMDDTLDGCSEMGRWWVGEVWAVGGRGMGCVGWGDIRDGGRKERHCAAVAAS